MLHSTNAGFLLWHDVTCFRGSLVFHIHCWSLTLTRWHVSATPHLETLRTFYGWYGMIDMICKCPLPFFYSTYNRVFPFSSHRLPSHLSLWLPLIPEKKPTGWVANRLTSWRQTLGKRIPFPQHRGLGPLPPPIPPRHQTKRGTANATKCQ